MAPGNKCLVCGSNNIEFSLGCKDHLTGEKNFDIYACKSCGFLFTANPPSEDEIGKYYAAVDYISHSDAKRGLTNSLYHLVRRLMLSRKRCIISHSTGLKTGKLLDMGCGTGYFAGFMKQAGWKVTGLEKNEGARKFASSKFNLEVLEDSDLEKYEDNYFDCITLWHVFEHFHDPLKYLVLIKRLLKPGGICIAAMPNCSSYDAQHYRQFWAAWDVPRHLWHFTPDTFRAFAEKNGFELTGIKRLPADVFYISILSERQRGTNLPFISGMIKGFWFLGLSIFRRNRSSSLIYILTVDPLHR
jgi:SAM-dependent methyltransferase